MTQILAVDVHYGGQVAVAAGVLFSSWTAFEADDEIVHALEIDSEYIPGQFYLRELPCILALLNSLAYRPEIIVIDGYVTLGIDRKAGLGQHLWDALDQMIPVIGVAKSKFHGTPREAHLLRGESQTPLYVTSVGIDLAVAQSGIGSMVGPYRIPTLLKRVDRLCRDGLEQAE